MRKACFAAMGLAALTLTATFGFADNNSDRGRVFEVTITNITRAQSFTPILVATHTRRISIFNLGEAASPGLALLAEDGSPVLLASELVSSGQVLDSQTNPGLLAPGASATVRVRANSRFDRLSLAAMLIPTNDTFMALNSLDLPWVGGAITRVLTAYDAGSEPNDERCANIPGPTCGGQGASPGGGEGYVYVSNGIHGIGDLGPNVYDWRNPVARVTIRRVD